MLARIRKTTDRPTFDLAAVMAARKAEFGDVRMETGDGGDGGAGGDGGDGGDGTGTGDSGTGDTGTGTGDSTGGGAGDRTFTQGDLDRILQTRLADERARFQRELDAEKEKAGKNAEERAELDRQRAETERDEARRALAQERLNNRARSAALAAKANPDRIDALVRLADLDGCADEAGVVDEGKVAAAIKKALDEFPEFKAKAGKSGGDLNGDSGKTDPTLADFRKMDYEARTKLYRENTELYEKLSEQDASTPV